VPGLAVLEVRVDLAVLVERADTDTGSRRRSSGGVHLPPQSGCRSAMEESFVERHELGREKAPGERGDCRAYTPGTHTRKDEDILLLEFPYNHSSTRSV
jgi:hypothetical protein